MINRPVVLHLFSTQHGVASIEQLRALPVSMDAIQRARTKGTVVNILPGIVRLAGTEESFASRAIALQLHLGSESFISGTSAGVLHGLRNMPRQPVEITAGQGRRVTMPEWGRLEYTSWIDVERDVHLRPDGLRVASPLRMLFRLARTFN